MISNPELRPLPTRSAKWPRLFSHWQLLSLVPGVVHRLQQGGRVLEIEVGGQALLASLARTYPASQFSGLTSQERAARGFGAAESTARNLHFRTVELVDLSRFRKVDLVLALAGVRDRGTLKEAAATMAPGGWLVLREEENAPLEMFAEYSVGTRLLPTVDFNWSSSAEVRHSLTTRALGAVFPSVHVVRLPEDRGHRYYIARAG